MKRGARIAAIVVIAGCQAYRPFNPPPAAADRTISLRRAEVTTVDGRTLNLVAVTITPDSVVGTMSGGRTALHRADVESIREYRTDLAATGTMVALTAAVVGGLLYLRILRDGVR